MLLLYVVPCSAGVALFARLALDVDREGTSEVSISELDHSMCRQ